MLMQVMESHMHRKRECVDIDTDDVSATSRKERKEMLLEVGENVLDLPRKEEHLPLTRQQLIELFTPPYDRLPLVEPPAQVNESKSRLIEPVRKESLSASSNKQEGDQRWTYQLSCRHYPSVSWLALRCNAVALEANAE